MHLTELDALSTTSLALIAAGAAVMATNIFGFTRLVRRHRTFGTDTYQTIRAFAHIPLLLMLFFLGGYIVVFLAMIEGLDIIGSLLVGLIFFGGALFVQNTISFQSKVLDELDHNREKLRHEALHDPLTGLPNRRLLMDRLQHVILRSERNPSTLFALVFIDLDRFKAINDTLGHTAGDTVLKDVSRRLGVALRELDTVARFGGDEFILLLESASPRRAVRIVRRIRAMLAEPIEVEGHRVSLTASFGIAVGPAKDTDAEQLLQNSTLALHKAKTSGRDRVKVFKADMLDQAVRTMVAENELRRAITQGEIILHYQPVIALHPAPRLSGFEALARWDHPTRGLVPPSEFIPLAEETGLIVDPGDRVIDEACRTLAKWRAASPHAHDIRIAINVSPAQFGLSHLTRSLTRATEHHAIPCTALTLEITESTLMDNQDLSAQRLERLRADGFSVAIDDFGQGYSSLAYVKDFPADIIKIDRAFISGIEASACDMEIVRCMVLMAHSLGKRTVAEGVENPGQLRLLQTMGCECVQGFHFSRPVPEHEAEAMLAAQGTALLDKLPPADAPDAACALPHTVRH